MPVGYGIGDHILFVIDILTSSLIGCNPRKIARAAARRLNTMISEVKARYVHRPEALTKHHKMVDKVQSFLRKVQFEEELKVGLDALDAEMNQ